MKNFAVTGLILDGIGDADHIFKGGERLKEAYPEFIFTYHVQWLIARNPVIEIKRLTMLIDKLLYLKLLSGNRQDYLLPSSEEIIDKINRNSEGKLILYASKNDPNHDTKVTWEDFSRIDVDGWAVFSTPPLLMMGDEDINIKLPLHKTIALLEHETDAVYDLISSFEDENYIKAMSFSKKGGKKGPGIFLEDLAYSAQDRAGYLSRIKNPSFHQLLHGKISIDPENASRYIEKTIFVPCYFLYETIGFKYLLAAYKAVLGPENNNDLFLQGKVSIDERNIEDINTLRQLGFNTVKIYGHNGKCQRIAIKNAIGKKTVTISNALYSEEDYRLFTSLATVFIGCSGDNTVQFSFSSNVIPLFMPHYNEKTQLLLGLARDIIKTEFQPDDPEIAEVLVHLSLYEDLIGEDEGIEEKLQLLVEKLAMLSLPLLLQGWKKVGKYLVENYNAHDALLEMFDNNLLRIQKHQYHVSKKRPGYEEKDPSDAQGSKASVFGVFASASRLEKKEANQKPGGCSLM